VRHEVGCEKFAKNLGHFVSALLSGCLSPSLF
jgi:hypothetical protein